MSDPRNSVDDETADRGVLAAQRGLRLVCANLPHLSGLAHAVRLRADSRVSVAAVSASGRVLINPRLFARLPVAVAAYVLAHELLHLALDSFGRQGSMDAVTVNYAHDYIINDMLTQELGMEPPLGGLHWSGAAQQSLEQVVTWMRQAPPRACWVTIADWPSEVGVMSRALRQAGLIPDPGAVSSPASQSSRSVLDILKRCDLIPLELERELFPDEPPAPATQLAELRREAARSLSLAVIRRQALGDRLRGTGTGRSEALVTALHGFYRTPWESALQRWMEAVAPGRRSFARPSRRGADRNDVVLPGRLRDGWTLHVVLDTSGSMSDELPRVLGAMASFCQGAGVKDVHILQCDVEVTADEHVPVEKLENYCIAGLGGSDISPAMQRLADDPEVTAAIVLTDGWISYPAAEPAYRVLWAVTELGFNPPYGDVLYIG